jgi:hypothetical protein
MQDIHNLFDEKEFRLLSSASAMRTKLTATEKMQKLLELTRQSIDKKIERTDPRWHRAIHWQPPKISRGENYNGLPYLVLDHPRYYRRPDILSFRILFWWGKYFCHSLHISGKFLEVNRQRFTANHAALQGKNVFLGVGPNPWNYIFDDANYKSLDALSSAEFSKAVQHTDHLKISVQWPLDQWAGLPAASPDILTLFMKLLA